MTCLQASCTTTTTERIVREQINCPPAYLEVCQDIASLQSTKLEAFKIDAKGNKIEYKICQAKHRQLVECIHQYNENVLPSGN